MQDSWKVRRKKNQIVFTGKNDYRRIEDHNCFENM